MISPIVGHYHTLISRKASLKGEEPSQTPFQKLTGCQFPTLKVDESLKWRGHLNNAKPQHIIWDTLGQKNPLNQEVLLLIIRPIRLTEKLNNFRVGLLCGWSWQKKKVKKKAKAFIWFCEFLAGLFLEQKVRNHPMYTLGFFSQVF